MYKMKERVVVAMSGGVDSSLAAALLQKEGYEVIGITMCFGLTDSGRKKPACCGIQAIEDAARVAHKLGIKHYVLNFSKELEDKVIRNFLSEYLKGKTPNPCVRCNQYIKFGALLKKALALDAKFLATGHYARIEKSPGHKVTTSPVYFLKKAKDKKKDQSYFLYRLSQQQLKHIIFPLGNYTKEQVRVLARKFALPVADKKASQEICFLAEDDYRYFIKSRIAQQIKPGLVVDNKGNVLGQHKGIAFYTLGQRQGLGIAQGYPAYITRIDSRSNKITLGSQKEALGCEFLVSQPHFIHSPRLWRGSVSTSGKSCLLRRGSRRLISYPVKNKIAVMAKIRYNHRQVRAVIQASGKKLKVCLNKPQFAVTPGQSAVFYDHDTVLGGGIIENVLS